MFRTQTLASFEPVDKQKEAAEAQVYEVFDQTVGLDSFQVRELPIENTRAGLYIYLNAAVSATYSARTIDRHTLTFNSSLAGH
jgi:mediator of RNA polymerase II transcription subunit 5